MRLSAAVVASLLFLCAAVPARAADESTNSLTKLSAWFNNLKQGLQNSAVSGRQQKRRTSAVAAVRGDEQTAVDPDRPEWKRSTRSEKAELRKEKTELAGAVDMIVAGKYEEGKSAIDAFEKAHPKSPLLDEARKARENSDLLAQLRGAQAKAEPAPTSPKETAPAAAKEATASADMKDAPAAPKEAATAAPTEAAEVKN